MSGPIGSSQWMYSSGTAGFYPYSIDQSLRFEESGAANLTFTPSNNGTDNKKFTYSVWIKRGQSSADDQHLIQSKNAGSGTGQGQVGFFLDTSDSLDVYTQNGGANPTGTRLLRDHSGWYHCCFVYDTTETASDRVKVYINGDRDTLSGSFPPLNSVMSSMNYNGQEQYIGKYVAGYTRYFNGYMAEIHMVDGQALSPTDFAEEVNGIWVPKQYVDNGTTSHGVNGYHLDFADSANIGNDVSGNNNDWTANNLAASDVMSGESPTNNWCTNNGAMRANITHSEGNLKMVGVGGNFDNMAGTFLFDVEDTDGWYWEGYVNSGGVEVRFGISKPQNIYFNQSDPTFNFAHSSDGIAYKGNGSKSTGGVDSSYGDSFTTGDVIGIAVKAGALYFYKNGTIQNSGTAAATGLTGQYVPAVSINSTLSLSTNYGQDSTFAGAVTAGGNTDANGYGDFKYSVPSGYKSLCSANLPEPTIGPNSAEQADDYFNTVLYTGDGSSSNAITGVGFQPDWTWIKTRNGTASHALFDSVRGADNVLRSNGTDAENASAISTASFGGLTSFDSDGFTVDDGTDGTFDATNGSSDTYVAWNWKAGGSASSNSDGSITSQVSAAPDAGFSIGTYTGTGANATIGHGLSSAPEMIIVKSRTQAGTQWPIYHKYIASDAETDHVFLNATDAAGDAATYWNDTAPTTSVFSVGTAQNTNNSGEDLVFYAFHSVPGYQAVGKYRGNGNANGTFVYTGFRPAFLLIGKTAVG
ncbi:hypothetical protein OAN83_04175, partial [Alphaproteobacteria bacterium]|nr:hypothetical protein [Alphaproteobacteria bacterium]